MNHRIAVAGGHMAVGQRSGIATRQLAELGRIEVGVDSLEAHVAVVHRPACFACQTAHIFIACTEVVVHGVGEAVFKVSLVFSHGAAHGEAREPDHRHGRVDSAVIQSHQTAENQIGIVVLHGSCPCPTIRDGETTRCLAVEELGSLIQSVNKDAEVYLELIMGFGAKIAFQHKDVLHHTAVAHFSEHAGIDHNAFPLFVELGGVVLQAGDDMAVAVESACVGDLGTADRNPVVRAHVDVGRELAVSGRTRLHGTICIIVGASVHQADEPGQVFRGVDVVGVEILGLLADDFRPHVANNIGRGNGESADGVRQVSIGEDERQRTVGGQSVAPNAFFDLQWDFDDQLPAMRFRSTV